MKPRDSLQRENFSTYMLALYLVAGLALSEVFLGWYLVSQDYGRVSYIRILLTTAVWIGLWVQSHAARHLGAFNFAAVLVFLSGALSLITSYILLFSKKFISEFARLEQMQPDYEKSAHRPCDICVRYCNHKRHLSFVFTLMRAAC